MGNAFLSLLLNGNSPPSSVVGGRYTQKQFWEDVAVELVVEMNPSIVQNIPISDGSSCNAVRRETVDPMWTVLRRFLRTLDRSVVSFKSVVREFRFSNSHLPVGDPMRVNPEDIIMFNGGADFRVCPGLQHLFFDSLIKSPRMWFTVHGHRIDAVLFMDSILPACVARIEEDIARGRITAAETNSISAVYFVLSLAIAC